MYATTYHIGHNTHARSAKAKTIAPSVGRVRKLDATHKGCTRNTERQAAACADSDGANGFLRTSFLPKWKETKTILDSRKSEKTERDFYKSLSQMAEHYNILPMQTQSYGYPYNIALALWDMERHLKNKVQDWEAIRLIQDGRKTFLTTEERYNTGLMLYYIPVLPLYRMLKTAKRKQAAQLLLSVCSYLHHVASIPYYRQEDSFLYTEYEMLKEWVLEDEYSDEMNCHLRELTLGAWIGDRMEQKIFNGANLKILKQRITGFKDSDTLDHDCWLLACEALDLYEKYPDSTVFGNARPNGETDDDDDDGMDNIVTMDKYISFCADGKGWLHENLVQCVNTALQEYGRLEEPAIIKRFDGSNITPNTLAFERRLFTLMEDLIYILNNF